MSDIDVRAIVADAITPERIGALLLDTFDPDAEATALPLPLAESWQSRRMSEAPPPPEDGPLGTRPGTRSRRGFNASP